MPSGLPTDAPPFPNAAFVKPTVVLTFQTPKLPFFLPQTGQYIHDFVILDIGLDAQYLTGNKYGLILTSLRIAYPREDVALNFHTRVLTGTPF